MKQIVWGIGWVSMSMTLVAAPACQQRVMAQFSQVLKTTPSLTQKMVQREQANRLFQQSRFKQALAANLPWAKAGDRRAQLEVGFMYEFGKGIELNSQRAALWYFAAIRLNAYNMKPLARGYRYFCAPKPDYATAARWFRMAAELSNDKY